MFKCKKCNKEFKNMYYLKRHKNRKYPCKMVGDNTFQCEICNKTYSTKGNLQRHITKSHIDNEYSVDKTEEDFRNQNRFHQ